ncbi:ElaB/YqjD/DUF883 family membrane-anchored ribosome-binding protein [Pseudomonas sp. PvP001]|jgi:ElaB/YqjD/DUF883 family membrane-anchored ribosome-binding protein
MALNLRDHPYSKHPDATHMEINMATPTTKAAQEVLKADFQALVRDTEKLLEHTASIAGTQAEELRAQINESLLKARESLQQTKETAAERSQEAVVAAEGYVQENPWQSVGIAAGVGFLLGLLATRH